VAACLWLGDNIVILSMVKRVQHSNRLWGPHHLRNSNWKVDPQLSVKLVVAQLQLQCQLLHASSFVPVATLVAVLVTLPVATPVAVPVAAPVAVLVATRVAVKVSVKYWD
jgi:hypothetical protein